MDPDIAHVEALKRACVARDGFRGNPCPEHRGYQEDHAIQITSAVIHDGRIVVEVAWVEEPQAILYYSNDDGVRKGKLERTGFSGYIQGRPRYDFDARTGEPLRSRTPKAMVLALRAVLDTMKEAKAA